MRELDPGVTAIVSGSYSNDPILANPGESGFAAVVAKPYTLPLLSDTVARVIDANRRTGRQAT